jgi:4-amino-4-deoxy-L-arabinose transferase-like glycosyltransferase
MDTEASPDRTLPRWLWIALAAALVARLGIVFAVLPNSQRAAAATDAKQYLTLGHNLATHHVFSRGTDTPYPPDQLRTPGYPALIALLVMAAGPRSLPALILVQALIGTLTVGGTALLVRRLSGDAAGLIAGLLLAFAPASLILTGYASAETLFAAWLVGGCWLLVAGLEGDRWPLSAAAGAAFGFAALTRPIGIVLLPALLLAVAVHWLIRRTSPRWLARAIRHGAALILPFMLLAGSWMTRNAVCFGHFSMSTIGGVNLYYYNAASLEAHRLGISLDESRTTLAERLAAQPPADPDWPSDTMGAYARRLILAHPVRFAFYNGLDALNGLRPGFSYMLRLFRREDATDNPIDQFRHGGLSGALDALRGQHTKLLLAALGMTAYTLTMVALAAVEGLTLLLRRRLLAACLLVLIPAILLYLPGIASNARFRAPAEPFLAALAAIALGWLWEILPISEWRRIKKTARLA